MVKGKLHVLHGLACSNEKPILHIACHHMTDCPGFSWDRVNFLSSSWYSIMFWIQYEKNVDNTLMFSVVAK